MRSALVILLLAVPTFANTGFFFQPQNPAHGFDFRYAQQESFLISGYGSGSLPLCAIPGTMCNPNTVLTPIAGVGDFGYHHHHDPLVFSGWTIDVTGQSFLTPTTGTILRTVSFTGKGFPLWLDSSGVIELTFNQGKMTDERLVLNPEPKTWLLLGTGLIATLLLVNRERQYNQ